jgi:hypothetical protein
MNPTFNGQRFAEAEQEWEMQEASHATAANLEGEWEAEPEFFQRRLRGIQKAARATAPIAKHLAPIAAKTLIGSLPNRIPRNLLNSWLREGAAIATTMETEMFGNNEFEAEISTSETAYETALAEVLAAEASHSNSEAEAEAFLGAAIPGIVSSLGGKQALRAVMPTLVQANARLVQLLHQRGAAGQRLMRLVPSILRRTVASLSAAHRAGRTINSSMALQMLATHAAQVFGNSQIVTRGIVRNALIQKRATR